MEPNCETPNISVIIHVYNTEKYLRQCIESLTNQNLSLEIIIVDDGSTDGSGQTADELGKRDRRIKIIRQENKSLAAARNRGIDEATGEYVCFLDSDDLIKDHALEYLYSEASKRRVDVIMGNAIFFYPDGRIDNVGSPFGKITGETAGVPLTGKQCFVELMKKSAYVPMVYFYICRREYLRSRHFFFEDVMHED